MKYKILNSKNKAEKLQSDILKFNRFINPNINAECWQNETKNKNKEEYAVVVPENFKYPFRVKENDLESEEVTGENDFNDLVDIDFNDYDIVFSVKKEVK